VYNANRINNTIKQSGLENRAAGQDLEQLKRDVALNVSTFYLNILFAKESIANAQKQIAQTRNQQALLEKQILVGNRPENDRMELEAQLATNEQTLVEAENQLSIGVLNMKQLLRMSPDEPFDIVVPDALQPTTDPDLLPFNTLLASALGTQPGVAAREWQWKSAVLGEKIAASQLYPSLAVGGNLRSNYSNKGFRISGYDSQVINQSVFINGQEVTVGFPQNIPQFEETPYANQFRDNLSYGVFVNMSIPIYNNYSARLGVQRAKINRESALLNFEQAKESLKMTAGQALNDAKVAKARFNAAEKARNAQTNLYTNALKRFDNGGLNTFELTRLKTQLESAEISYLMARYEYIFRTRVLDFYLGKGISLSN
jgi:outer membrane protein